MNLPTYLSSRGRGRLRCSSSCGAHGGFLRRHDEDLREPLVRRQGSQVSMRVARGSASWPSRARTLEAGKRWARLAQARAASRPGLCATETLGKTKTPIGNPIPTSYKEQSISKGFKCCHSVITTALSKNPVGRGLQYERLLTTPFAVTCKSPGNRNFPPPETPPGHHATVPEDSLPDYQEEAGFTHCQVHPRL